MTKEKFKKRIFQENYVILRIKVLLFTENIGQSIWIFKLKIASTKIKIDSI